MHAWLGVYGRQAGSMPWITTTLSYPFACCHVTRACARKDTAVPHRQHKSEKETFGSVIITCPSHTLAIPRPTPLTAKQ
jgi:hypothetical protein